MQQHSNRAVAVAADAARLSEEFRYFGRHKDDVMGFEEFRRFLQAFDANKSIAECRIGFSEIDTDHDGVIDFAEFSNWWGAP